MMNYGQPDLPVSSHSVRSIHEDCLVLFIMGNLVPWFSRMVNNSNLQICSGYGSTLRCQTAI